ncbi:SDR family NAD(P)-dependent oxidoreductase [Roseixanthobacter glucoisosaccharinicivorans]|uniref:SDR family NAD(P)-dependent oxidoreductase n=1 Tax=Roseixanthobacter glucoisosaccharinicivorans TaxID=3119923 RepID=UPI003729D7F6
MSGIERFTLAGKVVMITGASKGVGRAIALACAACGADVVLGARNSGRTEAVAEECRALGRQAFAGVLDVTDATSIETFVAAALEAMGRIDVLVNNAGQTMVKPAIEFTPEEFDRISDLNFKGAFFVSTAVARSMIDRQVNGAVINISSQSGHVGAPFRAVYAGSKGALNQLTTTLAGEWAPHGITVNGVSPTFTRSDMLEKAMENADFRAMVARVPLGRPAEPDEIASAVIFLASGAARMVTGHTLLVDGGYTSIRS